MHTDHTRPTRAIVSVLVFLVGVITVTSTGPAMEARSRHARGELAPASARKPDKEAARRVRVGYSGMPLRFERASGAAAGDAEFIARGAGTRWTSPKARPGWPWGRLRKGHAARL